MTYTKGGVATRTEATREAYRARFRRLMHQHFRETHSTDYGDFVTWLINNKRNGRYSIDTWWQYKSAIMAVFSESKKQGLSDLIERLRDEPTDGARKKGQSPKGKSRSVTQKKRDYLFRVVTHYSQPLVAHRIRTFIDVGILTGLRPIEWGQAKLEVLNGHYVLTVVNAKNTNERSHGEIRRMEILTKEGVRLIREHFRLINDYMNPKNGGERNFESYIDTVRSSMYRAYNRAQKEEAYYGIKTRPDRIYLYSARHQFKNNAKGSGLPPIERAYLMGHASVETNQRNYGRRNVKTTGRFGIKRYSEIPQVLLDSQARFEAERAESSIQVKIQTVIPAYTSAVFSYAFYSLAFR